MEFQNKVIKKIKESQYLKKYGKFLRIIKIYDSAYFKSSLNVKQN